MPMTTTELIPAVDQPLVSDIEAACDAFQAADSPVRPTILWRDETLSARYDADFYLALETHQTIGAYKIRGAYNFMRQLTEQEAVNGVVAASAGNHAQGVAYSARREGIDATIFMPLNTPDYKVEKVRRFGGTAVNVHLVGETFDDAAAAADRYSQAQAAIQVHPFDDRRVISGQGTLGLEIYEQLPSVDTVLCPIGGGGLVAGVANALKSRRPEAEVIGVEPAEAASMTEALESGGPVEVENIDTFVDGAAVKKVGNNTYELSNELVDEVITVSRQAVRGAVTNLWGRDDKLLRAEAAGSLTVAGAEDIFHRNPYQLAGRTVVAIVSGGNLSQSRFEKEFAVAGY